ncbi:MAG: sugar phosphate isomerase/epimerase [Spirochaetes bacterium]|nr:sugar phosphate isomerase/epimerase [Spirochaetota bacterium]
MNLGVRAHDAGKCRLEDFELFAQKISSYGFKSIQLAMQKSIEGLSLKPGYLNPGIANYIRKALDKNGLYTAVLGCYINPVHPDKNIRRMHLDTFKDHIKFARDFGCSVVGTETGSINPDCSYNQGTYTDQVFNEFIKSIVELVEEASKFGVFVAIEAVANTHTIDTPERMKRVIDIVKSDNLQVIFDPVNMLDDNNINKQDDMIKESFDLLADRMVVIHAKDFIIDNGKRKRVPAGRGLFNFELFFKLLKEYRPYITVLLEDSKPDSFADSMSFINGIYDKC